MGFASISSISEDQTYVVDKNFGLTLFLLLFLLPMLLSCQIVSSKTGRFYLWKAWFMVMAPKHSKYFLRMISCLLLLRLMAPISPVCLHWSIGPLKIFCINKLTPLLISISSKDKGNMVSSCFPSYLPYYLSNLSYCSIKLA